MRDLFARWATRATGATEPESARNDGTFHGAGDVAHDSAARATRATETPAVGYAVAHVAHWQRARATKAEVEKGKQDKPFCGVLPVLPMLPTETSDAERCSEADCVALVREAFEAVRAEYVDGALALLDADPDLCRRFRESEAAIDAAVKVGPTEHELRAALAAHVIVIRECSARMRARRERDAQATPALPPGTVGAAGFMLDTRSRGAL